MLESNRTGAVMEEALVAVIRVLHSLQEIRVAQAKMSLEEADHHMARVKPLRTTLLQQRACLMAEPLVAA